MNVFIILVIGAVLLMAYAIYSAGHMDENGVIHKGKNLLDLFNLRKKNG